MSEGPERRRFCQNCGTQIGETTNFCPNCGAAQRPDPDVPSGPPPPMPETGRVGTPSDPTVPPPPPGQPGGRSPIAKWIGGCAVALLVLIGLTTCAALIGGGGEEGEETTETASTEKEKPKKDKERKKQQDQESTVAIRQPVDVADATWVVTRADRVNQLRDQFGIDPPRQGDFVIVDFTFTNNGDEAKTLTQQIMALYDSSNRKSSPDTDTFRYIPNEKNIFLNQVNPGVTEDGEVIFSVAPDASGFRLELSNTSFLRSDKAYVDLGF